MQKTPNKNLNLEILMLPATFSSPSALSLLYAIWAIKSEYICMMHVFMNGLYCSRVPICWAAKEQEENPNELYPDSPGAYARKVDRKE